MKSKNLIYGLIGLVSSSAVSGLLLVSKTQAQSPNSEHNSHHSSKQANPPKKGMMMQTDQHFIEMMIPHHQQAVEMADKPSLSLKVKQRKLGRWNNGIKIGISPSLCKTL